jgi:hypothetical protein
MKTRHSAAAAVLGLVMLTATAFGQSQPPQIVGTRMYYTPTYGQGWYYGVASDELGPFSPAEFSQEIVHELDYIRIEVDVDLPGASSQDVSQVELFYGKWSVASTFALESPEAPPVDADTSFHFEGGLPVGTLQQAPIINIAGTVFTIEVDFLAPEFNGANQSRLRGYINYDLGYVVSFWAWNSESAGQSVPPGFTFLLYVVESPYLRPQNDPPAFPDAGADQFAAAGSVVELDAQRTFDSFNLGFDYLDPNVFEKDNLSFAWEWVSGPQRVDPVFPDPARYPWLAEVTLDALGTYVYRVFVSDGVNPVPQSDTVTIEVLATLPINHRPHAMIHGPTDPVVVGQIITLDASESTDPDGNRLHFRWRQTDEVGEDIPFDMLASTFQPMGGLQTAVSQWQAINPGTYYFILLVDDLKLTDSATTSVTVIPSAAAGESVVRESTDGSGQAAPLAVTPGAACGAGLLPLLLAPLALALLRGRVR